MSGDDFWTVLRGAGVVGTGMVASKAFTLIAELLVARGLGPALFGEAMLAYTVVLTLAGVLVMGIPEGFVYFVTRADSDDEILATIVVGTGAVLVGGAVAAGLILATPPAVYGLVGFGPDLHRWLVLLTPLLVVYPLSRLSFGIMRAYDRAVPRVLADDVLNKVLALGAAGGFLLAGDLTGAFVGFYLGQYVLSAVFAVAFVALLLRERTAGRAPQTSRIRRTGRSLFSYSWPLALKGAVRLILGNLDIIMIGLFLPAVAVGNYRVAFVTAQLGLIALMAVGYLYTPRLTALYQEEAMDAAGQLYARASGVVVLFALPLAVTLFAFPAVFLRTVFGPAYVGGAIVVRILTLDVLLRSGLGLAAANLKAGGHTRVESGAVAVALGLNVVLNLALIPTFGIAGAAVGTLLGALALNGIELLAVYRFDGLLPFDPRTGAVVAIVTVAAAPVFLVVSVLPFVGPLGAMVLFGGCLVLIDGGIVWIAVLDPATRRRVSGKLPSVRR